MAHANAPAEEPIAPPPEHDALEQEVTAVRADDVLAESGELVAFVAEADSIPHLLYEIGRLRERTFRSVGEGTGRALDLDRFDGHYLHIVLWSRERREVVGSYRCGLTDRILPRLGPDGLYTSTLFAYRMELLVRLTPAVELGRAFVRAEYQRTYSPLLLLWRAIGQFVALNPRYHRLFGSVSITRELPRRARLSILRYLLDQAYLPGFARFVKARHPVDEESIARPGAGPRFAQMAELERTVSALAGGAGAVPVLLKQYLKLGGRVFGFGRDPGFHDTLDVLTLVDLTCTPDEMLGRYLGRGNVEPFLDYHRFRGPGIRAAEAAA